MGEILSIADLGAQLSMASSAESMVLISVIQLIISIIGTLFLILTVIQGRYSLRIANESLEDQRTLARKEIMAYISSSVTGCYHSGGTFVTKIRVYNGGTTPAYIKSISLGSGIYDVGVSEIDPEMHRLNGETFLPSNDEINIPLECYYDLDDNKLKALLSRHLKNMGLVVGVKVVVSYEDVFKVLHESNFFMTFKVEGERSYALNYLGKNGLFEVIN